MTVRQHMVLGPDVSLAGSQEGKIDRESSTEKGQQEPRDDPEPVMMTWNPD